jgi:hypothetical protein
MGEGRELSLLMGYHNKPLKKIIIMALMAYRFFTVYKWEKRGQ